MQRRLPFGGLRSLFSWFFCRAVIIWQPYRHNMTALLSRSLNGENDAANSLSEFLQSQKCRVSLLLVAPVAPLTAKLDEALLVSEVKKQAGEGGCHIQYRYPPIGEA